jgi:hypothetical protein
MAADVKHEFPHPWGHNALRPLSTGYRDWHDHSHYMTPTDTFDTMLLMELDKEAATVAALILDNLSFDHDF